MGHRPLVGWTHQLRIFPKRAASVYGLAWTFPIGFAFGQFVVAQINIQLARNSIDRDHVTRFNQSDRATGRRLRPHVTHAKTACRTGETPICDEGNFFAHALARKRSCSGEHFAHARAT